MTSASGGIRDVGDRFGRVDGEDDIAPDKRDPPAPVLVVDDDRATRRLIAAILTSDGFEVVEARDGRHALDLLAVGRYAAVVLDQRMPGLSGHQVLSSLRLHHRTNSLPVILLTGDETAINCVAGLEAGANDFLVKPFDPDELVARIKAQVRTRSYWNDAIRERVGQRSAIARALSQSPGSTASEIAESFCAEVSSLPRRSGAALMVFTSDGVIPLSGRHLSGWPLTAGRSLSGRLAAYLRLRARQGPWLEHLEVDELSVLAGGPFPARGLLAFAPLQRGPELLGLFILATEGEDHDGGSTHADSPLAEATDYAAIASSLLAPHVELGFDRAAQEAADIRLIEDRAFSPVFQPIVRLSDGVVSGQEALTRFHDGVNPAQHFERAVVSGRAIELELATLRAALEASSPMPADQFLCLNVSPTLVACGDTLAAVLDRVRHQVVLEITEHHPVEDYPALREALGRIRPTVQLSVDDAGAGFASLRHILELNPDFIKLDRCLVRDIDEKPAQRALVAGMVQYAKASGSRLVAEGVETASELAAIGALGFDYGQGFYLGRPAALTVPGQA